MEDELHPLLTQLINIWWYVAHVTELFKEEVTIHLRVVTIHLLKNLAFTPQSLSNVQSLIFWCFVYSYFYLGTWKAISSLKITCSLYKLSSSLCCSISKQKSWRLTLSSSCRCCKLQLVLTTAICKTSKFLSHKTHKHPAI